MQTPRQVQPDSDQIATTIKRIYQSYIIALL